MKSSFLINSSSFLLVVSLFPNIVNQLGAANSVKRLRAWPQTVETIDAQFIKGHQGQDYSAIVLDNRRLFYDALYYGLADTAPIYIWQESRELHSHADLTHPFSQAASPKNGTPVLLINYAFDNLEDFNADFERLDPLPVIEIDLGGGKMRQLKAWAAYGYGPQN